MILQLPFSIIAEQYICSLSLGKDGMHLLSTWSSEYNRTSNVEAAGEYNAIPNIAITEDARPNTIYEGAYGAGAQTHLNVLREEDESSRPASPARYSTGFPESLDVPRSANSARNSMLTLISALDQELKLPQPHPPLSSASDVTLFDFNPSSDGLAESTPYEGQKIGPRRSTEENAPPAPRMTAQPKTSRRSSIVYIKSDENTSPIIQTTAGTSTTEKTSPTTGFAEWSRLLPKKGSKLQVRAGKLVAQEIAGLRPLSLLQEHDPNRGPETATPTKPLTIGKKKKNAKPVNDENAAPVKRESSFKRGLKPFQLARNETTKQRAALREQEVLPDVVVRPPSDGHRLGYDYSFR